ncbi:MAG TPA: hypothetical protein PLD46_07140 [Hyphomicrobium sp.]|nr:hypothetical protein [Hyphomicrobium sp.]
MTNLDSQGQIGSASPAGRISIADGEWPEFRAWYALILEEERLYNISPTPSDLEACLDSLHARLLPLERAMTSRQPREMVHIAMLGIIALRWSARLENAHAVYRALELGTQRPDIPVGHLPELALLEGVVRMALDQNLLPGIVVYDRHGERIAA